MPFAYPSAAQLRDIGASFGLNLTHEEAVEYRDITRPLFDLAALADGLDDYLPEVRYPRTPGYRPDAEEDPNNAWYYKTAIKGAPEGRLKGKRVAVKDNVLVAGVPMMNGSNLLKGYVPEIDATIVTRILDAGGEIAGKVHCEYFCLSGNSHTNDTGPVHNALRHGYSTGGSSSGSAAVVASNEVPMSIGADQGGSIRMPAALAGICGMKATYGLVPYTGIMGMESTIDHVGPMTATVADNALLLDVIAGPDDLDGRQQNVQAKPYVEALEKGVKGLRIAIIKEGFGHPGSDAGADAKVLQACERFRELGATVEEIAFPLHNEIAALYFPMLAEGCMRQMLLGNGVTYGMNNVFPPSLVARVSGWQAHANELPVTVAAQALVGAHLIRTYGGQVYAKGLNFRRKAKKAYADLMKTYDLFLMPTVPSPARPFPAPTASRAEIMDFAFAPVPNTAPYNFLGMPSMTVPCGLVDGLPVGLMITAAWWDEPTIYSAAQAFADAGDWRMF